jgi:hypothetical protein
MCSLGYSGFAMKWPVHRSNVISEQGAIKKQSSLAGRLAKAITRST